MDSEKSKPVTELSLEELLSVAEADKPAAPPKKEDDVANFLAAYKITTGPHKVKKPFLYEFYKQWSKDPIPSRTFSGLAAAYLKENQTCWFLDQKAFDIVTKIAELTQARKQDPTKSRKFRNHMEFFCAANAVKRGDFYFPTTILYILYRTWCRNNSYKIAFKIGRFNAMCKHYFEYKMVKETLLVRINTSVLQYLSKEQLEKLNSGKYEEKPPKPAKIPLFKPGL